MHIDRKYIAECKVQKPCWKQKLFELLASFRPAVAKIPVQGAWSNCRLSGWIEREPACHQINWTIMETLGFYPLEVCVFFPPWNFETNLHFGSFWSRISSCDRLPRLTNLLSWSRNNPHLLSRQGLQTAKKPSWLSRMVTGVTMCHDMTKVDGFFLAQRIP